MRRLLIGSDPLDLRWSRRPAAPDGTPYSYDQYVGRFRSGDSRSFWCHCDGGFCCLRPWCFRTCTGIAKERFRPETVRHPSKPSGVRTSVQLGRSCSSHHPFRDGAHAEAFVTTFSERAVDDAFTDTQISGDLLRIEALLFPKETGARHLIRGKTKIHAATFTPMISRSRRTVVRLICNRSAI